MIVCFCPEYFDGFATIYPNIKANERFENRYCAEGAIEIYIISIHWYIVLISFYCFSSLQNFFQWLSLTGHHQSHITISIPVNLIHNIGPDMCCAPISLRLGQGFETKYSSELNDSASRPCTVQAFTAKKIYIRSVTECMMFCADTQTLLKITHDRN